MLPQAQQDVFSIAPCCKLAARTTVLCEDCPNIPGSLYKWAMSSQLLESLLRVSRQRCTSPVPHDSSKTVLFPVVRGAETTYSVLPIKRRGGNKSDRRCVWRVVRVNVATLNRAIARLGTKKNA